MKLLSLTRDIFTDSLISGWLSFNGRKWATLERPWLPDQFGKGGKPGRSCVPEGEYQLLPWNTENHPNVWALSNPSLDVYREVNGVPSYKLGYVRTTCLIHVANYVSELRGCIGLGKLRRQDGQDWILKNSRDAINELRTIAIGADLKLIIESRK